MENFSFSSTLLSFLISIMFIVVGFFLLLFWITLDVLFINESIKSPIVRWMPPRLPDFHLLQSRPSVPLHAEHSLGVGSPPCDRDRGRQC